MGGSRVAIVRSPKRSRQLLLGKLAGSVIVCAGLLLAAGPPVYALLSQQQGGSVSTSGHKTHQPTALTSGLIDWYSFEGSANDSSGKGVNGTLTNFNGNATDGYTTGKFGKGLLFDGTDDYVSIPGGSFPAMADNLTLSAWIYPTSTAAIEVIFSQGGSGFGFSARINSGGTLTAYYPGNTQLQSSSSVATNAWSHIVYTKSDNGSGTCAEAWYINNVAAGTSTNCGGSPYIDNTNTKYVGTRDATQQYFPGTIDDFRLYNRAITSTEVASLYAGSKPATCDQSCLGWWKLDEASGTSAADASSKGNTGTLTGFNFTSADGWTGGIFGNGLKFDGSTSEYVDTANSFSFALNQGFTYEAWVTTPTPASTHYIMDRTPTSSTSPDFLMQSSTFCVRVFGASSACSGTVSANTWYFVVGVRDPATTSMKLYVNGSLVATTGSASMSATGTFAIRIGAHGAGTFLWGGTIDDARVYSRALTADEIYDQYVAGR